MTNSITLPTPNFSGVRNEDQDTESSASLQSLTRSAMKTIRLTIQLAQANAQTEEEREEIERLRRGFDAYCDLGDIVG